MPVVGRLKTTADAACLYCEASRADVVSVCPRARGHPQRPLPAPSTPPTAPTPAFVVKLLSTGAASQVSTACVPYPTSQTPHRWSVPSWQRDRTQAFPGRRTNRELGIGSRRRVPGSQAVQHLLQDVLPSELLPLCWLHYDVVDGHGVTKMATESPDGLTSSP